MFTNKSVDEINRLGNTGNYERKPGILEVGTSGEYVDTKKLYSAVSPDNAPAVLAFDNVSVSTKPKRGKPIKFILNKIRGCISGGLWAIMGASGSGKTTLLSVLSLRLDTNRMNIDGDVRINGKVYNKNLLKAMSGYVMQDDLVHAELTCSETLMYTAALRLPKGTPLDERKLRVDEALKTVGIEYCRDVIVGDTRNKGISGGERKRLCVAMELLTRPKLLFLDEPTSGLDSATALSLMSTLKDLCERGACTVVCTIHQPQTKIFCLIDNLLLMKRGEIIYQGSCANAENYFAEAGYPCPDKMNPADHMLDCVTIGTHDDKAEREILKLAVPLCLDYGCNMDDFATRSVQPWLWQFLVLTHRNLKEKFRRWDIIAMNVLISTIIAVFISCGPWSNIGRYQESIVKRNGIIFFCTIHQGLVPSLQGTYAFPMERALMLRERAAGAYYVSAYFLAKTAIDSIFQLMAPFIFTAFVYPIIGLNPAGNKPFVFLGIQLLLCNAAVSLSNMCSCVFVSIDLATLVLACSMEITRLYSSFYISPKLLDSHERWKFFDQISYLKYGYVGLVLNEYQGLEYKCGTALQPREVCTKDDILFGEQTMYQYGYDRFTIPYCAGCLVAYIGVCRFASYLSLRYLKA